jgi:predicted MFS family arabinose efflux permease
MIEVSWAGSSLIGLPLVGLLIDRFGWRSPFFALGGTALIGVVALRMLIPNEGKRTTGARHPVTNFWYSWHRLVQERAAIGALGYTFFVSAANDNLFVVYGAWLERTFGLSIVALGISTSVIGLAELSGEGLTASLADRLGLKRAILLGLILSSLSYLILPVLDHSLPLALVALFVVFVTFEFTIVTSMSFFTEILPDARATMMSGFLAFASIGRICGTLIGGKLWSTERILVIGLVSACMSSFALFALFWGLRNWQPKSNEVAHELNELRE